MSNIEDNKRMRPTMEDIRNLSFNEHVIHEVLVIQHKHGLTDEEALIMMVFEMTKLKNDFMQQAVDNASKRGGLVRPDGGDYPLKWMSQPREE